MNAEFGFNTEYLKECFKKRKKPEERIYPKKDWPVGYEPTKKEYEEWMEEGTGIPVSYHEEDIGGGRKRGVFTPIKKNIKILDNFEKALGNGQPVNFKIKGSDGELRKVSKEEFANWITEGKEEKNVETPPKERLIYGASGDIDSITVFTEIRSKDGIIKESYYQPRSEEEKQQIRKRQEINRKKREQELEEKKVLERQNQEKSQNENSPNSTKKDNNSQNPSQKIDNNTKKVFYGMGAVSLIVLVVSMLIVWIKKK